MIKIGLKKRTTIRKKQLLLRTKKIPKRKGVKAKKISSEHKLGQSIGKLAVALWKSQKAPGKVYVAGHRIHHGPVGALLTLAGAYYNSSELVGFGEELVKDDIDDLPQWFDFEREPMSLNGFA